MSEFTPGDVVRLKSGGPKMTVEQVGKEGAEAVCCFFVRKKLIRETLQTAAIDLTGKRAEEDGDVD